MAQLHTPLPLSFQRTQATGTIVIMAIAAPQAIALVMNSLDNTSGEHIEDVIKALEALPQCMNAGSVI